MLIRINILEKNITNALVDIKIILKQFHTLQKEEEVQNMMLWNIEKLAISASNYLLMFRIQQNQLTLLRSGKMNANLLSLSSLRDVLEEGTEIFRNSIFPISKISRANLPYILELVEIQTVGPRNFVMLIPLVTKEKYNIYLVIPHPLRISSDTLMVADVKNTILVQNETHITTDFSKLRKVMNQTYIMTEVEPIYSSDHSTCEWEGWRNNTNLILELCNFQKLGTTQGIHMTNIGRNRLVYFTKETVVTLNCPDGKIRDNLVGLNKVPHGCDLNTDSVHWPAQQSREIQVESLIAPTNEGDSFDITHLPTIDVNTSNPLHKSIKTLINELPEGDSLTIDFKALDLTLEEVQSWSILVQSIMICIIIVHSVGIALLICHFRKNRKTDTDHQLESGIANKIIKKLQPRGSLKFAPRDSFRRARDRLRKKLSYQAESSGQSSIRSQFKRGSSLSSMSNSF